MDKIAAIWARVSTDSQNETSLPMQIDHIKTKLESMGYTIPPEYIFAVDWASFELLTCPEYIKLNGLIMHKEVQAVGIENRDRLPANFDERLMFFSECKRAGVTVIPVQGDPIKDDDMGELIEHIYTVTKKQSVMRARIGSSQGLRDRVIKFRKPVTFRNPFGYRWAGNDKKEKERELTLSPDDNYKTVKLIFEFFKDGKSYDYILLQLKERGIVSPTGLPEWNKQALHSLVFNPLYTGKFYALKKIAVAPSQRKEGGRTYGNTSAKILPLDKAEYLPNIKIINPPWTEADREATIEQFAVHQKLASRNAKREYLLRGFIYCDQHVGKNGKPRLYHGRPHHGSFAYACPVGKCKHSHISGPLLETDIKTRVSRLVLMPCPVVFSVENGSKKHLKDELKAIQREYKLKTDALTTLESRNLNGEILDDVYRKNKEPLQARAKWLMKRRDELLDQLSQLKEVDAAAAVFTDIKERFGKNFNKMTHDQWRELLTLLNLEIHVNYPEMPVSPKMAQVIDMIKNNPFKDIKLIPDEEFYHYNIPWVRVKWGIAITHEIQERIEAIVLGKQIPDTVGAVGMAIASNDPSQFRHKVGMSSIVSNGPRLVRHNNRHVYPLPVF